MAGIPVYTRLDNTGLYIADTPPPPGMAYWQGYYATDPTGLPDQPTLAQLWAHTQGAFLLINSGPSDPVAFAVTLAQSWQRLAPQHDLRLLWLLDPNSDFAVWRFHRLRATFNGQWTTSGAAEFRLGDYAYTVSVGTTLTLTDTLITLAGELSFEATNGSYPATSGKLDFAGASAGVLSLRIVAQDLDDMQRLGVMLRYATPDPDDPEYLVAHVNMPILGASTASDYALDVAFDPLNPLLPARTALSFASPPTFSSLLATTLGHGVDLAPGNDGVLPSGQLVFAYSPTELPGSASPDRVRYHLVPYGQFVLSVAPTARAVVGTERVMLGLSATEYFALPDQAARIGFDVGAAYAPTTNNGPLLTDAASTAYAKFYPAAPAAAGLLYYAQPQSSPLYAPLKQAFLSYHEMPAAQGPALPGSDALGASDAQFLPMGAYLGVDPAQNALAAMLESAALAPLRRSLLGLAPTALPIAADPPPPLAVTPRGLLAGLSPDGIHFANVLLSSLPGTVYPDTRLAPVNDVMQAALQANQLFFVAADVTVLMGATSVPYRLQESDRGLLLSAGVSQAGTDQVMAAVKAQGYPTYPTEAAFTAAIGALSPDDLAGVLSVAGVLRVNVDGWTFQLSPRTWRGGDRPTLMLFKYASRSIIELAGDTSAWGWPAVAGTPLQTQKVLLDFIAGAKSAPAGSPKADLYANVLSDANWNGVLFINAPVSIAELDPQLAFLSAGIKPDQFFADHVGFALTPFDVDAGTITPKRTAVFGLIDYQDPSDLLLSATVPFAFKTLSLTAIFSNSSLTGFHANVELMTNRLFGSTLTKVQPERGNNLVLDGSYHLVDGAPAYAFSLIGQNRYAVQSSMLGSVEVLAVQLQTLQDKPGSSEYLTRFVLNGNLRFLDLPDFDPFCYGTALGELSSNASDSKLRFNGLAVDMRYDLDNPGNASFSSNETGLAFDLASSVPRPQSLAARFPLTLTGIVGFGADADAANTPESLSFVSIAAPLQQQPMTPPWYGLVYTLQLGTLGALAGSVGLSIKLIAAFAPGQSGSRPAYIGLELPNAKSMGLNLPLQGVLQLGFRSFEMQSYPHKDDPTQRGYLLRLHRFALSVLGFSFPPGNTDVLLFGDTDDSGKVVLGWYAAYAQDAKPANKTSALRRRHSPHALASHRESRSRRDLTTGEH